MLLDSMVLFFDRCNIIEIVILGETRWCGASIEVQSIMELVELTELDGMEFDQGVFIEFTRFVGVGLD